MTDLHTASRQRTRGLVPGTVIHGKYRVVSMSGEGGFALVYEATHERVRSLRLAIKILRPELATDASAVTRFLREAEMAAQLRGANVVRVSDLGELDGGIPFMVMEFIEGRDVASLIRERRTLGGELVASLTRDILLALEEAHSYGIVHRDLKPENVFAQPQAGARFPVAKVGDFGIAKVVDPNSPLAPNATQTAAGNVLCTPAYAAPELLNGKTTPQIDFYALGHMMAEMLEGVTPYDAEHSVLLAVKHLDAHPVPLGPLTSASPLADVIRRAVQKDPTRRYQTATEMRADVERVIAGMSGVLPVSAPRTLPAATPVTPPPAGRTVGALQSAPDTPAAFPAAPPPQGASPHAAQALPTAPGASTRPAPVRGRTAVAAPDERPAQQRGITGSSAKTWIAAAIAGLVVVAAGALLLTSVLGGSGDEASSATVDVSEAAPDPSAPEDSPSTAPATSPEPSPRSDAVAPEAALGAVEGSGAPAPPLPTTDQALAEPVPETPPVVADPDPAAVVDVDPEPADPPVQARPRREEREPEEVREERPERVERPADPEPADPPEVERERGTEPDAEPEPVEAAPAEEAPEPEDEVNPFQPGLLRGDR